MKIFLNEQDKEDHEQELAIKQWLGRNGGGDFEYTSITRSGRCKHLGDMGSFSLDEKISKTADSSTYADIIGEHCRGIEEYGGCASDDPGEADKIGMYLEIVLGSLNINREARLWAKKTWLSRTNNGKLNSLIQNLH